MPLWKEGVNPVDDFNNFNENKNKVFHRQNLYDTIFLIQETGISPFAVVQLKRGGTSQGRLLNLLLSSRDVSGFDEKCVHTM
jgi:hypothetical protein